MQRYAPASHLPAVEPRGVKPHLSAVVWNKAAASKTKLWPPQKKSSKFAAGSALTLLSWVEHSGTYKRVAMKYNLRGKKKRRRKKKASLCAACVGGRLEGFWKIWSGRPHQHLVKARPCPQLLSAKASRTKVWCIKALPRCGCVGVGVCGCG